jgi:hypothetical protein
MVNLFKLAGYISDLLEVEMLETAQPQSTRVSQMKCLNAADNKENSTYVNVGLRGNI